MNWRLSRATPPAKCEAGNAALRMAGGRMTPGDKSPGEDSGDESPHSTGGSIAAREGTGSTVGLALSRAA